MVQESRRRRYEEEVAVRERERTHRRYLQDLRFQTYVAMITAANRVYAAVKHPTDVVPDVAVVHDLYESFMVSLSPAFMVAADEESREVIAALGKATRQLAEAVFYGDRNGDGLSDVDAAHPPLDALLRAHRRCVRRTEQVMRAELGITNGGTRSRSPSAGSPAGRDPTPVR